MPLGPDFLEISTPDFSHGWGVDEPLVKLHCVEDPLPFQVEDSKQDLTNCIYLRGVYSKALYQEILEFMS